MTTLSLFALQEYRQRTFRSSERLRIHNAVQAVEFVNERGFTFFWPIKDVLMPSLWVAAAGDRPVADSHNDPGHRTWGWKDDNLSKKVWYYTRLLRKKNTIIALDTAPYFYALSPNYGSPEEDYLIDYEEGRMPQETRLVYEALLNEGALNTLDLRKAARMTTRSSDGAFSRALEQLQVDMRILPVGVAKVGAWKYAFLYELVHRHYPDLIEQARPISEYEARRVLTEKYLQSVGAASLAEIQRVFNLWRKEDVSAALGKLVQAGRVLADINVEGGDVHVYAIPQLV